MSLHSSIRVVKALLPHCERNSRRHFHVEQRVWHFTSTVKLKSDYINCGRGHVVEIVVSISFNISLSHVSHSHTHTTWPSLLCNWPSVHLLFGGRAIRKTSSTQQASFLSDAIWCTCVCVVPFTLPSHADVLKRSTVVAALNNRTWWPQLPLVLPFHLLFHNRRSATGAQTLRQFSFSLFLFLSPSLSPSLPQGHINSNLCH